MAAYTQETMEQAQAKHRARAWAEHRAQAQSKNIEQHEHCTQSHDHAKYIQYPEHAAIEFFHDLEVFPEHAPRPRFCSYNITSSDLSPWLRQHHTSDLCRQHRRYEILSGSPSKYAWLAGARWVEQATSTVMTLGLIWLAFLTLSFYFLPSSFPMHYSKSSRSIIVPSI